MKQILILLLAVFSLSACTNEDTTGGTGSFTVQNGQTISGSCSEFKSTMGCSLKTVNINTKLFIENMPTDASGTFTIYGPNSNCKLQISMNRDIVGDQYTLVSISGTLKKTGARSFEFSCSMSNGNPNAKIYQVSGMGNY